MLSIAQLNGPVTVSGTVTVSATAGSPVPTSQASAVSALVSGVVGVVQSGAFGVLASGTVGVVQSGAFGVLASGVVGVVQSGAFAVLVSGSAAGPVWVTSSAGSPAFVAVTGAVPVSTGSMPVVSVTSSLAAPVWVTQSQPIGVSSSQFLSRDALGNDPALPVRAIFPIEHLSAFGELVTTAKACMLPLNFNYDWPGTHINTAFVTATLSNSGGLSVSSSMLQLSSSTDASGSSLVQSRAAVRYIAGTGLYASYTALFTSGVADSQQITGLGDAADGMFWMYSGTQFGVMVRNGGVETFTPTGSFSHDHLDGTGPSGYVLSPTSLELFKVEVGWHGSGPIKFYTFNVATGRWVLGHVASGFVTVPRLQNPTLPLRFEVKNQGNTSNLILKTASAGVYRESVAIGDIPLDALVVASGSSVSVGATELPVISLQVTSSINGQPNRARVQLASLSVTDGGGAGTVIFVRARLNPTTLTGASFQPYNTGTSVSNFDTVASAVAGGSEVFGTVANGQSTSYQDVTAAGIVLNPGDILSITAQHVAGGASTNLIRATFRELHTG